jgi:type IV secretion system protein VirB4
MARTVKELHEIANAERSFVDCVPYSSEIAQGVVKLSGNNGYMTSFEIEGVTFETSGQEDLEMHLGAFHQFLKGLDGGAYSIWTHKTHFRVKEQLQDNFSNEFSQKLAREYAVRMEQAKFIRTTLYLTVIYRPGELATFKNVGLGTDEQIAALEKEGIEHIEELAARVDSSMRDFKPRRLMWYEKNDVTCSELKSFLGLLINGFWEDFPVNHRRMAPTLCSTRLIAGDRSGVLKLTMPEQTRFVSCLEVKEYSEKVTPLSLSKLLYVDQEFIETQSFSILGNRNAIHRMKRQRGQLKAGGEASKTEIEEFDHAIESVNKGDLLMGEYHYSIAVFSDTLDAIKKDRSRMAAAFEAEGFKVVVQTSIPEASWAFQQPGNWKYRTRDALLTSWNFACLSPLHNFMAGKKTGNPWGEAVCVFDSPSGQPFFFNFHCSPQDHDSTDDKLPANTCIFGRTGVGKTTLEMFLLAHLNKYGARSMVLDKNRSTEITIRRMGGTYKSFEVGQPTGMNPFQWPDTARNRSFCRSLVKQCMTSGQYELMPDEENRLSKAVDAVFEMRWESRRLALLAQFLPNTEQNSMQSRLWRWVNDGDLAWVLDNPVDTLNLREGSLWGFDYSDFINDQQVFPVFSMCLLQMAEGLVDGRPFAIWLEEFWKILGYPVFSEFAKDKLKTIRKELGFVVMTTQQTDDVLSSDLAKTAVQQHVTGIYLPNPNAVRSDYVDGFGLTEQEFLIVKSLPVDSRAMLIKQDTRSAVVRFDLTGMQETIAVLSGDEETVELLAEIRGQVGDVPQDWEPVFLQRIAQKREDKKLKAELVKEVV